MESTVKKENILKKALQFTLMLLPVIIIASLFVTFWSIGLFTEAERNMIIEVHGSIEIFAMILTIQSVLPPIFCTFFGYVIAVKVRLLKPLTFKKRPLVITAIWSVIGGVGVLIMDQLFAIFTTVPEAQSMEELATSLLTPMGWGMRLLYGGVIEELLLRLFLMSFIALIIWKVFCRKYDSENIPVKVFIIANIIAAFLFGAGHLPVVFAQLDGVMIGFVIRTVFLNMFGGVIFGELYRKYGLQYAIIAHTGFHVVMGSIQLILS